MLPQSRPECRCCAFRTFRSGWRPPMHRCRVGFVHGFARTSASSTSCSSKTFTAPSAFSALERPSAPACRTFCRRMERSRHRVSVGGPPSSGPSLCCGRGGRCAKPRRACTCPSPSVSNTSPKARIPHASTRSLPRSISQAGTAPLARASTSVVYLGRLDPIKRIDVLLDAFARVRAELPDATLEVIGAPTAHGDELRARAGEGVSFRGLIPEEEKSRALGSAQVFALLSASEGLPVAPLEALACGTPVVLSPGCGLPEVDGVAGIVCDGSADWGRRSAAHAPARPRAGCGTRSGRKNVRVPLTGVREVVPALVALLERVATSSSSAA